MPRCMSPRGADTLHLDLPDRPMPRQRSRCADEGLQAGEPTTTSPSGGFGPSRAPRGSAAAASQPLKLLNRRICGCHEESGRPTTAGVEACLRLLQVVRRLLAQVCCVSARTPHKGAIFLLRAGVLTFSARNRGRLRKVVECSVCRGWLEPGVIELHQFRKRGPFLPDAQDLLDQPFGFCQALAMF